MRRMRSSYKMISPIVFSFKLAMANNRVLFPQPEEPIIDTVSPLPKEKEISFKISLFPMVRLNSFKHNIIVPQTVLLPHHYNLNLIHFNRKIRIKS